MRAIRRNITLGWAVWALGVVTALWQAPAQAGTPNVTVSPKVVSVAAAADAKFAFDEIVAAFEKEHPETKVRVSYGSSGNFYTQLSQRAPFDIFFSADVSYPSRLVDAGLASADAKFVYAIGRIVVWAPTNSPVNPGADKVDALKQHSVKHVAIANPQHAPYGKAAVVAMQKLGVYETVKEKLVYGENIAQAAQFVESGAAEIGIIALSLAEAPRMKAKGNYWEIPREAYPQLEQAGVILSWAQNPKETKELKDFVLGESGRRILRRYGFSIPGE